MPSAGSPRHAPQSPASLGRASRHLRRLPQAPTVADDAEAEALRGHPVQVPIPAPAWHQTDDDDRQRQGRPGRHRTSRLEAHSQPLVASAKPRLSTQRTWPPYPPEATESRKRSPWRRGVLVVVLVVVTSLVTAMASMIPALTAPGSMSTTARIAEWARNEGLGPVVTWLEKQTYQPPKVGGAPGGNSPLTHHAQAVPVPKHVALPAPVTPLASPPLPGEGTWRTVATVHGQPAMAETFLRPDAVHTSYTAAAVWFDPQLIRATLHPGSSQPGGGGWGVPDHITMPSGLRAAFNAGFKLADAHGGYYQNGQYAKFLQPGGASMVFYKNGTMTVGQWARDVHMGPNIAAVRQNLALIVDRGHVVPGLNDNYQQQWGATVGNKKFVWRSGIGVTAGGDIVSVIGPRLSAHSLATLLQHAGCVRAMQLDINQEWTSYVLYHANGDAKPTNLLSTMQRSPSRYNTTSARDFVTLHAR